MLESKQNHQSATLDLRARSFSSRTTVPSNGYDYDDLVSSGTRYILKERFDKYLEVGIAVIERGPLNGSPSYHYQHDCQMGRIPQHGKTMQLWGIIQESAPGAVNYSADLPEKLREKVLIASGHPTVFVFPTNAPFISIIAKMNDVLDQAVLAGVNPGRVRSLAEESCTIWNQRFLDSQWEEANRAVTSFFNQENDAEALKFTAMILKIREEANDASVKLCPVMNSSLSSTVKQLRSVREILKGRIDALDLLAE